MSVEKIEALVVGAGQAGLAMSGHLGQRGVPHLVLERSRIAERWRSERWDGLVANGPAWHDCYPGLEFPGYDPDAFVPKEKIADSFVAYAEKIKAPIRCGVEVKSVRKNDGRPGFRVETPQGAIEANFVIAATGAFQKPIIPALVPESAGIMQIHSTAYRNPGQLPEGAVLVVGAGSSGAQIAEELMRAGKRVYLSVGPHDRPPRRYRGRDFCWWLGVLGKWDAAAPAEGREHVTIAVSGADGGKTVDFRNLAAAGHDAARQNEIVQGRCDAFRADLARNVAQGDANYLSVLDEADAFVARNGLDLAEEPEARIIGPDPECMTDPIRELNLATPVSQRLSGQRVFRLIMAGCRWMRLTRKASRSTSAAFHPNRASISSDCHGCHAGDQASSGASGMTPSIWRTISPRSAAIWRIKGPRKTETGNRQ